MKTITSTTTTGQNLGKFFEALRAYIIVSGRLPKEAGSTWREVDWRKPV